MKLGMEVFLGPRHILLDGDPSPQKRGHTPNFCLVWCGQTARMIKMPLGTEVCLGPGHIVLDGDPAPPPKKGAQPAPNFWPMSVVAKRSPISATAECWVLVHFWCCLAQVVLKKRPLNWCLFWSVQYVHLQKILWQCTSCICQYITRVPTNLENLELSGNFVNLEKSGNLWYGPKGIFLWHVTWFTTCLLMSWSLHVMCKLN